jgi:putative transposase
MPWKQAPWSRTGTEGLIHHCDRSSQGGFQWSSQHLEVGGAARDDHGVESSVGSVGDSYDNALAERLIGLFRTGVICRRCWKCRITANSKVSAMAE